MPSGTLLTDGVSVAVITLWLVCGNETTTGPTSSHASNVSPELIFEPPNHFILNPDLRRPPGYPAEISLKELEIFLKTQQPTGQGCGGMTWEGVPCGLFSNGYAAAKTPWLNDPVTFDAAFAQTKTGTFFAGLTLGRNTYRRPDRKSDKLIWERNYEPQYAQQAVYQVLFGNDSTKRVELLEKIRDSLQGLDVRGFPANARAALRQQMQHCERDADPAVGRMAKDIGNMLSQP